jgi:L-seryl-tRNA(Ser) seleniumtransferase
VNVAVEPCRSTVGGGAMPMAELPSWAVTVSGSADAVDAKLRTAAVPVVARVEDGKVWLDLRTIAPSDIEDIIRALT